MSSLESRARSLLRFYPPCYRADRGEEMLSTLVEDSAPGRNWPTLRDARSLIVGGLRARSAQHRRLPLGTSLRLVLMLGLVLWLAAIPSTAMNFVPLWPGAAYETCALLLAATIVAPWFARRGVTISLALVTAVALGLLAYHVYEPHPVIGSVTYAPVLPLIIDVARFVVPPLALAAVVAAEPVRPPRCWLWLPGAMAAAFALLYTGARLDISPLASSIAGIAGTVILWGLLCAIVLWLAADARPAIALVIALELAVAPDLVFQAIGGYASATSHFVLLALVPLAVGALAIVRLRRTPAL
jgi:hypothetical protein